MRVSQATIDSGNVNAIRMAPMILPPMDIKIPIIALSVNQMIAVSCVIEDKYTELAVRALHEAFELAKDRPTQ